MIEVSLVIEVSRFYGKKDELKKNEGTFPQRFINDLVCVKLNKIVKLQDIIEKVILIIN